MTQVDDLSRSVDAFDQDTSLTVVVEMSEASWLVTGMVPGVDRRPLKKLKPDPDALLRLVERWRSEAEKTGRTIERVALAYEAGRDGFWLARWLRVRGIEVHVIHSTSVAVSREHRRAKTDRLDTAMLMRVFLGWLRGERGHCGMVAIPTLEEEDAKRPSRERESLVGEHTRIVNRMKSALARLGIRGFKPKLRKAPERLAALRTPEGSAIPANMLDEFRRDMARLAVVREQIEEIEQARLERLEQAPAARPNAMVHLLARIIGVGIETADMLVREVLSRNLRDRRAVARYAGLTGSPDESGSKRREKGLARAGNARVRRGLIQLAWRLLMFQKDSALARWYRARTEGPKGARKTTMIVALARKLLIALWRMVTTGVVPEGFVLRQIA
jgi:transposase